MGVFPPLSPSPPLPIRLLALLIFLLIAPLVAQTTAQPLPADRLWIFLQPDPAATGTWGTTEAQERTLSLGRGPAIPDWSARELATIASLEARGFTVYRRSRYLRAVSGYTPVGARPWDWASLPGIASVRPVARFHISRDEIAPLQEKMLDTTWDDYGADRWQLELLHIPELHLLGLRGQGVRLALFDAGFEPSHPALTHAPPFATWDFVMNDAVVSPQENDPAGIANHGTATWSLISAYWPGKLIGAAPKVSVALARTEDISSETPVEEDNWVAATEWADSLGIQVISSSVGYVDWYTFADLDGLHAPITLAADAAVRRGIVVVQSAGNENTRAELDRRLLVAPADGFNVLAIGAVDHNGRIANFSSRGPTADGRIKPDLAAPGVATAIGSYPDGLSHGQGTSFAAPLVAGLCALIRQARPDADPATIRDLLRQSASLSTAPNDTFGWGIPNGWLAIQPMAGRPERWVIFPSPTRGPVQILYNTDSESFRNLRAEIRMLDGEPVRILSWSYPDQRAAVWDLTNSGGRTVAAGIYMIYLDDGVEQTLTKIAVQGTRTP